MVGSSEMVSRGGDSKSKVGGAAEMSSKLYLIHFEQHSDYCCPMHDSLACGNEMQHGGKVISISVGKK